MTRRWTIVLALVLGLSACSDAPAPDSVDARQALHLRVLNQVLADTSLRPDLRATSDIRIDNVHIERAEGLASGDYDLWMAFSILAADTAVEQQGVVTLTPHRDEWRVLSIRPQALP